MLCVLCCAACTVDPILDPFLLDREGDHPSSSEHGNRAAGVGWWKQLIVSGHCSRERNSPRRRMRRRVREEGEREREELVSSELRRDIPFGENELAQAGGDISPARMDYVDRGI